MALPFKKAGGGFLNNVAGVIIGIVFDTKLSSKPDVPEDKAWRKLNGKLVVKVDGAEAPVETFIDGGFIYDGAIQVEGAVIKGTDECPVRENSELGGFIGSLVENGVDEKEVGTGLDYGFLSGLRCHFVKVVDEERNKRQGKRKGKDGTKNAGKEFNHELLRVSKVYGREDVKKLMAALKAPVAGGSKPTSSPTSAPAASSANVDDAATTAILAIIEKAKDGKVKSSALGGAFVKYCLTANIGADDREPIRNRMTDETFIQGLAEAGVIAFDGKVIGATE